MIRANLTTYITTRITTIPSVILASQRQTWPPTFIVKEMLSLLTELFCYPPWVSFVFIYFLLQLWTIELLVAGFQQASCWRSWNTGLLCLLRLSLFSVQTQLRSTLLFFYPPGTDLVEMLKLQTRCFVVFCSGSQNRISPLTPTHCWKPWPADAIRASPLFSIQVCNKHRRDLEGKHGRDWTRFVFFLH